MACTVADEVLQYIATACLAIVALFAFYSIILVRKVIKSLKMLSRKRGKQFNIYIHLATITLLAAIILECCLYSMAHVIFCSEDARHAQYVLWWSGTAALGLQYWMLPLVFFYRLIDVFDNSAHKIPVSAKRVFWCCYAVFTSIGIVNVIIYNTPIYNTALGLVLPTTSCVLALAGMVAYLWSFTSKLRLILKIPNANKAKQNPVVHVILKNLVVSMFFITSMLSVLAVANLQSLFGSPFSSPSSAASATYSLVLLLNAISLIAAMLFAFSPFDRYYLVLCGCCHNMCMVQFTRSNTVVPIGDIAKQSQIPATCTLATTRITAAST